MVSDRWLIMPADVVACQVFDRTAIGAPAVVSWDDGSQRSSKAAGLDPRQIHTGSLASSCSC